MDSQGDIILNNRGLRTNSKFIHEGHFMQVKTKTSRLKWRSEEREAPVGHAAVRGPCLRLICWSRNAPPFVEELSVTTQKTGL